jgi:uncharacterized protein (TIGR02246 family)
MTITTSAIQKAASLFPAFLLGVVQVGTPGPLLAQADQGNAASPTAASAACDSPRFRDFDYWVGTWAVYNLEGTRIGTNTTSSASEGCAILEQWQPVQGPAGVSVNHYDPVGERWEQRWVGGGGLILRLAGEAEDGVMVLAGTEPRETPRGAVLDRISWIPEGETVRQLWEISVDGGESWQTAFVGIYRPAGPPSSARAGAAVNSDTSLEGVHDLREQWTAAYQAGDSASMVMFYTPDAVRLPYDAPAQEGRNAIIAAYESSFRERTFVPEIELVPMNVRSLGGEVLERGRYREVLRPRGGGRALVEEGKYVSVARPAADGRWRYSLSIFNRDAPARPLGEPEAAP